MLYLFEIYAFLTIITHIIPVLAQEIQSSNPGGSAAWIQIVDWNGHKRKKAYDTLVSTATL